MSDGITDCKRDDDMRDLMKVITMRWLRDEDYSVEMERLRNKPRGYFYESGRSYAEAIEHLFAECKGDKFEYLAPHYADGRFTPDDLRYMAKMGAK